MNPMNPSDGRPTTFESYDSLCNGPSVLNLDSTRSSALTTLAWAIAPAVSRESDPVSDIAASCYYYFLLLQLSPHRHVTANDISRSATIRDLVATSPPPCRHLASLTTTPTPPRHHLSATVISPPPRTIYYYHGMWAPCYFYESLLRRPLHL